VTDSDLEVTLTETNHIAVWRPYSMHPTFELTEDEAYDLANRLQFALDELRMQRGWGR